MYYGGAAITAVMTLSVVGFFIFLTVIAVVPLLIEIRKKNSPKEGEDNLTVDQIRENINLNSSFIYRFAIRLGEDKVTLNLLRISVTYLLSTLLCIGNLAVYSLGLYDKIFFLSVLTFNMILVFFITLYTVIILSRLIYNSWQISSKYLEGLRNSLKWIK